MACDPQLTELLDGPRYGHILSLAMPAVIENILVTLVFVVDQAFLGWLRDPTALAAAGISSAFMFVANGAFGALGVGATAMIARATGAQKHKEAEAVAAQALVLSILFSALVLVVFWPLAEPYYQLMAAGPEVSRAGSAYLRIVLSTSILSFPLMVCAGILRGAGDTKTPMWITAVMNLWNVIGTGVLVFGLGPFPALGLMGAGWATATARALGGLLIMVHLLRGHAGLRLSRSHLLQVDFSILRRLLAVSLPSLCESMVSRLGYTAFVRIVSSLGTAVMAAHQIALSLESISFMPGFGFSIAAATLVGQALGAKRSDVAERVVWKTLLLATGFMSLIGLLFLFYGPVLVQAFGGTPDVIRLAGHVIMISAVEQPFLGAFMVLTGCLRGAGDTRTPMWIALAGACVVRISIVYVLAVHLDWGLAGVWWGTAIDWSVRAGLAALFVFRGRWKEIEV